MIEWQDKIWGRTREIIATEYYSKHELLLSAGGYCSLHYHRHRANKFTLLAGKVEIVEFYGPSHSITTLTPGMIYCVPSCVAHMFIVYKDGEMIEEYYSDRGGIVDNSDIIRLSEGGFEAINLLSGILTKTIEQLTCSKT